MPPREYTPFQRFSGLKRTLLAGKERGTYDEKSGQFAAGAGDGAGAVYERHRGNEWGE